MIILTLTASERVLQIISHGEPVLNLYPNPPWRTSLGYNFKVFRFPNWSLGSRVSRISLGANETLLSLSIVENEKGRLINLPFVFASQTGVWEAEYLLNKFVYFVIIIFLTSEYFSVSSL